MAEHDYWVFMSGFVAGSLFCIAIIVWNGFQHMRGR